MKILVIDHNADGLDLLTRTLTRKFPSAEIIRCSESGECIEVAGKEKIDAIVVHRAIGMTGGELIRQLRTIDPSVPITMVSSTERSEEATKAGANAFLLYDSWLMLGGVVADTMGYDSRNPWKK